GQALLDVQVEPGVAEQARPARMGTPAADLAVDRVHDLGVEVEAEVIAGCVVGQPVVADPDAAAVDLVDDGVVHRGRRDQPGELVPPTRAADVGGGGGG